MAPYKPTTNNEGSSSTGNSVRGKKEEVKFSTLEHPPRANLLPSTALLCLLSVAFLCLLFVCFRRTEFIIRLRKKIKKWIQIRFFNSSLTSNHGPISLQDEHLNHHHRHLPPISSPTTTTNMNINSRSINSSASPVSPLPPPPSLFIDDYDDDEVLP